MGVVERGFCCVMQAPSIVLLALVLSLAGVYANDACPRVFDGLTNAHFDLSTQFSVSEISGNWAGLSRSEVLSYEWAVVSEAKVTPKFSEDCRSTQGFVGLPDVLHWQNVGKDSHGTANKLKLTPRTVYYIVLRTTLSNGVHVFSNSNGVRILPQELQLEGSHKKAQPESVETTASKRNLEQVVSECPIDQANRCAAAAVSPREILEELYGPPRFETPYLAFAVPVENSDDDDDDDWNEAAAIVPAVFVVFSFSDSLLLCSERREARTSSLRTYRLDRLSMWMQVSVPLPSTLLPMIPVLSSLIMTELD